MTREPAPDGRAARRDRRAVRVRHAGRPCRRQAGPGDGIPQRADPPDHVLRLRRRRPCGRALQPPDVRLHLFAADQPHRGCPRGAGRRAGGRPGGRRCGLGTCGPAPRLLHAAGSGRPRRRGTPALWRFADPAAAHLRPARLERDLRRRHGPVGGRGGDRRADQGRVRRIARQSGRRRGRSRGVGEHRARGVDPAPRRQHARDSRTCAGRSSGVPISSSTR